MGGDTEEGHQISAGRSSFLHRSIEADKFRWLWRETHLLNVIFNSPKIWSLSACPGLASDRYDAPLRSYAILSFPQYLSPGHKSVIATNVGVVEQTLLYMHCTWNHSGQRSYEEWDGSVSFTPPIHFCNCGNGVSTWGWVQGYTR